MRIAVTGGAGYLGGRLVERLLAAPAQDVEAVLVIDRTAPAVSHPRLSHAVLDIAAPDAWAVLEDHGIDTVYHLAALTNAPAEADFDAARVVNLTAVEGLLEALRRSGGKRLVAASSIAVFGAGDTAVTEASRPRPRNTYGALKAVMETLIAEYARKGFVDGRVARLPTVVVRHLARAKVASGFLSDLIRGLVDGRPVVCPVPLDLPLAVAGVETCLDLILRLGTLPAEAFADGERVVHLPAVTATVADIVAAVERATGRPCAHLVELAPRRDLTAQLGGWPGGFDSVLAGPLGLPRDRDLDAIIGAYVAWRDAVLVS